MPPWLDWKHTIPIPGATRLALHDTTHRLYVMTNATPGVIHVVDTDHHQPGATQVLPGKGLALAVSSDGTRLYAAVAGANPGDDQQLIVLDTKQLGTAKAVVQGGLPVPGSAGKDIDLAPLADGRLLALVRDLGELCVWSANLNQPGMVGLPDLIALPPNLRDLVLALDGGLACTTDAAQHNLHTVNLTATPPVKAADIAVDAAAAPFTLAVGHSTAGDTLVVGDMANKVLYLVAVPGPLPVKSVKLADLPVALAVSPGGAWVYVLEPDSANPAKYFVEPISTHRALLSKSKADVKRLPVGDNSTQLALAKSGRTLYTAGEGGVAIVDVAEQDCGDLLWHSLKGCPECDAPNCIVLATIAGYHVKDQLWDPPAKPDQAPAPHLVRIDNRTGRRLLPSVQTLTAIVECLLENEAGGAGVQGPPGPPGKDGTNGKNGIDGAPGLNGNDGLGIDRVDGTIVDCHQPGKVELQVIAGQRVLVVEVPRGCDAEPPKPIPLTHICAISWEHGKKAPPARILVERGRERGLVIAFDDFVRKEDLTPATVVVLAQHATTVTVNENDPITLACWCDLKCDLRPILLTQRCRIDDAFQDLDAAHPDPNGVWVVSTDFRPGWTYRVLVKGDFIRDKANSRGIDTDHLPPWLPFRPTGDGVEGGLFESWFTIAGDQ
jgi:hypothetical protein